MFDPKFAGAVRSIYSQVIPSISCMSKHLARRPRLPLIFVIGVWWRGSYEAANVIHQASEGIATEELGDEAGDSRWDAQGTVAALNDDPRTVERWRIAELNHLPKIDGEIAAILNQEALRTAYGPRSPAR